MQASATDNFIWLNETDRPVISPVLGGRVVSWQHADRGELVRPPDVVDGGLLRLMFGEERFPGASHVTPHWLRVVRCDAQGFVVELRGYLSTPNYFANRLGWPEKSNPSY